MAMATTKEMAEQSKAEETKCRRPWTSPASSRSLLFYKLIVPSIIQDKKLKIPSKLAKKIGDELSSVATLTVPNGRVWCLGLKTIGYKIWFDTGWQEFVEHYSINEGHFLVFSYQGGSNFNVQLFDLTTSEINYASKTTGNSEELTHGKKCPAPRKEDSTNDDSMEVLDSTPSSLKDKVFDQCGDHQSQSKNYNHPSLRNLIMAYEESVFGFNKDSNAASFDETKEDNQHLIKNPKNSQASVSFIRDVSLNSSEVKIAKSVYKTTGQRLHLAKNGVNLQPKFSQDIGLQFSESELTNSTEEVGLHLQGEAEHRFSRDIGIQVSESELTKSTDEVGLHLQGEGKPRFSRDCSIQFSESELTNSTDEVGLHLQGEGIKRFETSKRQTQRTESSEHEPSAKRKKEKVMNDIKVNSRVSTRTRAVTPQEKQSAIDAATAFKPDNPFCKVIMRPSSVYRGFLLHIPLSFGRKYMMSVSGMIKLQDSDGKQWPVGCINYSGKIMLSKKWNTFVKDKNLEEGDVCIFELIQVKDAVLKVTIFRVLEDTAPPTQPTST